MSDSIVGFQPNFHYPSLKVPTCDPMKQLKHRQIHKTDKNNRKKLGTHVHELGKTWKQNIPLKVCLMDFNDAFYLSFQGKVDLHQAIFSLFNTFCKSLDESSSTSLIAKASKDPLQLQWNDFIQMFLLRLLLFVLRIQELVEEDINLFFKLGVDFCHTDQNDNPLLYYAISAGRSSWTLKGIIKNTLNWKELRNNRGETALHIAAKAGNMKALVYLIRLGCDVHATDNYGNTPLHLAMHDGVPIELVWFLLRMQKGVKGKNADTHAKSNEGKTPLHLACQYVHPDIVSLILQNSFDVNEQDENGNTPIYYALLNNIDSQFKIFTYLTNRKAKTELFNNKNQTPLEFAQGNPNGVSDKVIAVLKKLNFQFESNLSAFEDSELYNDPSLDF